MTRWCKHVAVFAAWLGLGTVVLAQPGYPSPVGATRLPEPIRYVPDQPPPTLVPGPLTPQIAPVGPPDTLNLPADHTSAFQDDNFPPESAFFASAGGMALQRNGLTHLPVVFLDNQNLGIDTGRIPLGRLDTLLRVDEAAPSMRGGYRATVGYLYGSDAVELTGFYVPGGTNTATIAEQGSLFLPFANNMIVPKGFTGNRGLWNQADLAQISYTGAVGNLEANYRWWNSGIAGFEVITGIRYFYNQERIDILTDDDFLRRDLFDRPNAAWRATYSTSSRTNHVGVQFGLEYSTPLALDNTWLSSVWVTCLAKSTMGPSFVERSWRLSRGDGLSGLEVHRNNILFGSVSDVCACIDWHVLDRVRVRAGYTAIWGLGFSAAASQIDFDFSHQGKRGTDNGNIFWHGPMAETPRALPVDGTFSLGGEKRTGCGSAETVEKWRSRPLSSSTPAGRFETRRNSSAETRVLNWIWV
jgi:hypothetical protein